MKKVKLGEVCEIRIGKTPNRSQTLYWGGDYPWLSISDMKGKILCTTKEKITQEAVQKEKMQIVSKGTVVMSFKLSIGKVGILAENMYTNEAIANFVVKNNKMLFNEYLYYALQGMNFDSLTDRAVMGKTLNKAKLNNLSIVYNEPFMQQQIVLRLDGVNKLIESRKQQLSELSKLVKSRFNEMFGDPVLNDMGWEVTKLGELTNKISSGNTPKGGSQVYVDKGIMFFRSQNVWKNKILLDDIAYIDDKTNRNMKDTILEHGDLLITKTGRVNTENSSLGRTAQYLGQSGKANINGHVYLVRINSDISKRFILEILISNAYRDYIRRICVGGIDKRQLNKNHIEDFPIILPPLSLQNEFADFVAKVDKSQLAIQKSLEELETLKKSLMQEYFG